MSDYQDYFEYIIKKHETLSDIPQIRYTLTKLKAKLYLKLRLVIILNF